MNNFIKIIKHDITNGYLNLSDRSFTEYIVNTNEIVHADYNPNYPNGYGEYLSFLKIQTSRGDIVLYRQDADKAYKQLSKLFEKGI